MSMTLILWKGPVVRDSDAAEALLAPWYEQGDDSAFEPDDSVARFADELRRLYPDDLEGGLPADPSTPWADLPFEQTERLVALTVRWGADDAVLDSIGALARAHGLVLYDPQGPDIHLPDDPPEPVERSGPGAGDYVRTALLALAGALVAALGWWLPVPILNWLLIIAGAFVAAVALFILYIFAFHPPAPGK